MQIEMVSYDWAQITRAMAYLASVDDCLQRAQDGLEGWEAHECVPGYALGQVEKARTRLRRALNVFREVQVIDILLGAFELTPEPRSHEPSN